MKSSNLPLNPCHRHFLQSIFLVGLAGFLAFYATEASGEEITLAAVGDIMMGSTTPAAWLPPDDGEGLFQFVGDRLRGADIVFGNLEGTLMDGSEPGKCRGSKSPWCYEFKTPVRYGRHLKNNGFNAVSVANNHTWDFGWEGVNSTLKTLHEAGLQPVGGRALGTLEIRGKRIVLIGFSYLSNVYSYPIQEIGSAVEIVKKMKEQYDLVIVSFHGGAEGERATRVADAVEMFLGENRGNVVRFARTVVDAGADLVLGHGPHVLRRLEVYRGKLIAYSLGNFLTYGYFNVKGPNGVSVILQVRLDGDTGRFLEGRLVSVKQVKGGVPRIDPEGEGLRLMENLSRRNEGEGDSGLLICENGSLLPAGGDRTCQGKEVETVGQR